MPNLGFLLQSVGVGPAAYTWGHIAVAWVRSPAGRDIHEKLYQLGDLGASGSGLGPVLAGQVATAEFGGHAFPNHCRGGNFPVDLSGKYVRLEVEGSLSVGGKRRITLSIQQQGGREGLGTLYEWSQLVPIITSYMGGISIEGVATQRDLAVGTARGDFNTVMRFQQHQRAG